MSKVVYIVSAGHSGSTLLDMLIGTLPNTFSTGELVYFPYQIFRNGEMCPLHQDICTCNKRFTECTIWSEVLKKLNQKLDYNLREDPLKFKLSIINNQIFSKKSLLIRFSRLLVILGLQFKLFSFLINFFYIKYKNEIENNWLLFDTISEVTKKKYIIDSSKDFIRLKMLMKRRPNDVFVIILIREIFGVISSEYKKGKNYLKNAKKWLDHYNKRILPTIHNLPKNRYLVIHYEYFCRQPEETREKVAHFLGIKEKLMSIRINSREYHLIAGNPMRFNGNIIIKYNDTWKIKLSSEIKKRLNKIQNYLHSLYSNEEY